MKVVDAANERLAWHRGSSGVTGGFTVIEAVLFLAVTGLMVTGIFIGVSGALSRQLYEREVTEMIDFVQGQYSLVDNVRNNRPEDVACSSGSINPGGATSTRGSNINCLIVGRWIRSSSDGGMLTSRPVYSTAPINNHNTSSTEKAYLKSLQLRVPNADVVSDDSDNFKTDSGALYVNSNKSNRNLSMLIIKLPTSGAIRTYFVNKAVADGPTFANALLDDTEVNSQPLRVCLDSGVFGTPDSTGVRVEPMTSSVAGVQRISITDEGDRGC